MIVSCGEALIDFMPIEHEGAPAYRPFPGGSPFNVAIGLGRLGAPTGFLSRISTDFFGDLLLRTLHENGVDTRYVKRAADPSMLAFVSHRPEGEPQYAFFANGAADRCITEHDLPATLGDDVACLHLGLGAISTLAEPAASTFETLLKRESKRRVLALDPNVRPNLIKDRDAARARLESWVSLCDIVKVSCADFDWLYPDRSFEDSAVAWRNLGPKLVVMTLGADGAMALLDGAKVAVPGRKIGVVDTVGAGDSFHSALLAGLSERGLLTLDGMNKLDVGVLKILLDQAVAAAAITCSRAGANPPTKRELEDSL
ncbi:carbohydrate kinase [Dongia sp.]|uniref:carbohydrate kinase family protein n=1 Tax=Dongia sp. TaxID=1977262 RepID=UPI003751412E